MAEYSRTAVRFRPPPPITKGQPHSVGLFLCGVPRVRGGFCGSLRTSPPRPESPSRPYSALSWPFLSRPLLASKTRSPEEPQTPLLQINGLHQDFSSGWIASLPTRRKQSTCGCLSVLIERRHCASVLGTANYDLCGRSSSRVLLRADGIDRYSISPSNVSIRPFGHLEAAKVQNSHTPCPSPARARPRAYNECDRGAACPDRLHGLVSCPPSDAWPSALRIHASLASQGTGLAEENLHGRKANRLIDNARLSQQDRRCPG